MMLLLFRIDEDRYGLDVADVVELVPYVTLQKLPKAPDYLAGLLNYRGTVIPVVDLPRMIVNRPVKPVLSSRIVLIRTGQSAKRLVGLLVEGATATIKISDDEFIDTGIKNSSDTFVDKVVMDERGMIKLVDIGKLLPKEVRTMLDADSDGNTDVE